MDSWRLSRDGFIRNYMIAGPGITDYQTDTRDSNQLALEAKLRREIVSVKKPERTVSVRMGKEAENGCTWKYYYSHGNDFVDVSDFYSTLKRISLEAATVLVSEEEQKVRIALWTYMAAGVYCNGYLVGEQKEPGYKPIRKKEIELTLRQGRNLLVFQCENLGVRDSRNILGVQLLEYTGEITVALPDEDYQQEIGEAEAFLDQLTLEDGNICIAGEVPKGAEVCYPPESPDFEVVHRPVVWHSLENRKKAAIPEQYARAVVRIRVGGNVLKRTLELTERRKPVFSPEGISVEENFQAILERIAAVDSENRGPFGFAMANVLARKHLGCEKTSDRKLLFDTLDLIEQRVDCSDFILCGLLRYMHEYGLDAELEQRALEVLKGYRYWMTMEGADAMCFWSENHALMFYTAAMDVGAMYPAEYFTRAGMTGEQLHAYGKSKLEQWLADVEQYGFEEFLSTVYMCVTFAAIIHVVDYGQELSGRAAAVTDLLLRQLCRQSFRGCVIAPMGRVYREVLYPFDQGAQALMNLIDPEVPYSYGEGWLGYYASSSYRIPEGLLESMRQPAQLNYESGNARIVLEKGEAYCLTSVCSPREDSYLRWENIQKKPGVDRDTHEYNKSLNECFHGTTFFAPGIYGYQQHMWYAALDEEAAVFVNHPGATAEDSGMRPGYWNGNGIMPALHQEKGVLGAIYRIPDTYPVHFTHLYCPEGRFAEVKRDGNWIFLRKSEGYLGIWCSEALHKYNDMLFDCELRAYGDRMAYLCVCGEQKAYDTFQTFMEEVKAKHPVFDREELTLETADGYTLSYRAYEDVTQVID